MKKEIENKNGGEKMKKLAMLLVVVVLGVSVSSIAIAVLADPIELSPVQTSDANTNSVNKQCFKILKRRIEQPETETQNIVLAYAEDLQQSVKDEASLGEISDFIGDLESGKFEVGDISISVVTPEDIKMGIKPYVIVTIRKSSLDEGRLLFTSMFNKFQVFYDISNMDEQSVAVLGKIFSSKDPVGAHMLQSVVELLKESGANVYRVNYQTLEDIFKTIENPIY